MYTFLVNFTNTLHSFVLFKEKLSTLTISFDSVILKKNHQGQTKNSLKTTQNG